MSSNAENIIPEQHEGSETNTEAVETLSSEADARDFFQVVQHRLLNINSWHNYAGAGSAVFQLTDAQGHAVQRTAQKGDHIRIDIPGPGTRTGEGYDWVRIEEIAGEHKGAEDSLAIRVRPAPNPQNQNPDVAHFFSGEATSNFVASRRGNQVMAAVYGRNEKPNTGAQALMDKARNTAVAAGAAAGFSKLQWKSLVQGFLQR